MKQDQETLNFAAAVLSTIASVAALIAAGGGRGQRGTRAALMSGLLGTVGSAAWAIAAYRDKQASDARSGDERRPTLA